MVLLHFPVRLVPLFFLFTVSVTLSGQSQLPEFGEIRPSELSQPIPEYGQGSPAEMLFDHGKVTIDIKDYSMRMERHFRLRSYADSVSITQHVRTRFLSDDDIKQIKAFSYSLGGKDFEKIHKQERTVHLHQLSPDIDHLVFSDDLLHAGEVIEVSYVQEYDEWRDVDTWWVQQSIPVRISDFQIETPEYFEFEMRNRLGLGFDHLNTTTIKYGNVDMHITELQQEHIPAFELEPYSTLNSAYRWNVDFILRSVRLPFIADIEYYDRSPEELVKELATSRRYGKEMQGNEIFRPLLDSLGVYLGLELAQSIYRYVQEHIAYMPTESDQTIRGVYVTQKANHEDINRYLTAILHEAEFDVHPLLIRSAELAYPSNSEEGQEAFDRLVCNLTWQGKDIYLDASTSGLPFGTLDPSDRIGKGLLIDQDRPVWLDVEQGEVEKRVLSAQVRWEGKEAVASWKQLTNAYALYLDSTGSSTLNVLSDSSMLSANGSSPLKLVWSPDSAQVTFSAFPLAALSANPFKRAYRMQPVLLPAPMERRWSIMFTIPPGWQVTAIPESVDIGIPGMDALYRSKVDQVGGQLVVSSQFLLGHKTFYQEAYPYLKELLDTGIRNQSGKIILSRIE